MVKTIHHHITKYINDTEGATAIEYGLIGASIAVAITATAFLIGGEIDGTFNFILGELQ